ncbi:MAG: hypothetical protein QOG43_3104 [Actinomycetota bacterium]|nr:hypothetical protein [Actinomycetota bacterium]
MTVSGEHDVSPPVSPAQERLWLLDQLQPEGGACHLAVVLRVLGPLVPELLERALDALVSRHESLRSRFQPGPDGPAATVATDVAVELQRAHLGHRPPAERAVEAHRVFDALARDRFDLGAGLLVRAALAEVAPDEHLLLLATHRIAADEVSLSVLVADLAELYGGLAGARPPAPADAVSYREIAVAQLLAWQSGDMKPALDHWQEHLTGASLQLDLPTDRPRPAVQSQRGARHQWFLPAAVAERLGADRRRPSILLAAFAALLHRLTGSDDLLVGTTTSRRPPATEAVVGPLANSLVLRVGAADDPSFSTLVDRVAEEERRAEDHGDLPFEQLVRCLNPERDLSRAPLCQVAFRMGVTLPTGLEAGAVVFLPDEILAGGADLDLVLTVRPAPAGLAASLDYAVDLFDAATVARMAGHLDTLLTAGLADDRCPISRLPLLTPDEIREQDEWNATEVPFPEDRCAHELFEEQAARTPGAIAVEHDGRMLSYAELDARANQLARYLQRFGVGADSLVGLLVSRTHLLLVAILGVLKAGAAYVPLEPTYPSERLQFMLDDAGVALLLTEDGLDALVPEVGAPIVRLDRDSDRIAAEATAKPAAAVGPANLAYVIYTSGSTGRPKGVEIEHRALVNLLSFMTDKPGLTVGDVAVGVTTPAFDLSVPDLYLPLVVGARLVVAPPGAALDGAALSALLKGCGATFMQATPSTWRLLIDAGWAGDPALTIVTGGETTPRGLADLLLTRGRAVWNMYGPTEATVWCSTDPVGPGTGPLPLGGPAANTRFRVLDANRQPVPVGVEGELYVGGAGLARGYHQRPALTAARFVADPFQPGARLYRTGDLVTRRADGRLEFRGRIDHQVKLRGFRIELGEIEAALAEHPAVQAAVVVTSGATQESTRLVAYLVTDGSATATASELRRWLLRQLPSHMVPATFVFLASLPISPNGKVDRKRLPAPDGARPELEVAYVAPRTPVEEMTAETWAEVLGSERVGIDDNFFELGGNSLQATQAVLRLSRLFDVAIPLRLIFESPTVGELAEAVVRILAEQAFENGELAGVLADLDS